MIFSGLTYSPTKYACMRLIFYIIQTDYNYMGATDRLSLGDPSTSIPIKKKHNYEAHTQYILPL